MSKKVLLVGFGKLGQSIANNIIKNKHQLTVLKRTYVSPQNDISFINHDIRTSIPNTLLHAQFDEVIICVTPNGRNKVAYQDVFLDGVLPFCKSINTKHIWFISSSAVYEQNDGSVVNEQSHCAPTSFNGQVLLQCENEILKHCKKHNIKATMLRLAGIYGADRRHLINLIEDGFYPEQLHYTNRIHQEDAANIIATLIDKQVKESVINVCDNYSATLQEVADYIREIIHVPNKKQWLKPLQQNKQISNQLLKTYFNDFKYPTYKQGFIDSLEHS
ncbi:MAG: NAD-dependent epimerase/dehydratase family protein [Saccharospirillaceae bacterium]|nr:NAD-dependent epimerase/dehydratase family protein [Pseudomonadales bacterium]NRB78470.1 NAD-dependent epimerase/dehydratase family protein [Saccharospirillaceae bacterium]